MPTEAPSVESDRPTGPLHGVRVLDLSALGPGPFCSMLLADFGAEVISVERPESPPFDPAGFFARGKRSVVVDLRAPGGPEVVARLAEHVDVLLESNRPGTLERRGLGPDELCARNPRLVYARLTGWGQDGPYRDRVGHDINYIAASGVLGTLARAVKPDPGGTAGAAGSPPPVPPLAFVGDLAGGSLHAALGILLALFERSVTGRGQVVDAAIVDGAALLNTPQLGELAAGRWAGRGRHILSGAAPFYGVYRCADDRYFAVGAIEPRFYAAFLAALGLDDVPVDPASQHDPAGWPALRARVAEAFRSRPRDAWTRVFAEVDGCGTPVLELGELAEDEHLAARGTVTLGGAGPVAAPAPRLSRTPGRAGPPPLARGADTEAVLAEAGMAAAEIARLAESGAVRLGRELP